MSNPGQSQFLVDLLGLQRLTTIVDVGANPVDGDPPYKTLLDLGLAAVVGFEPQAEALASLNLRKGSNETYLPYAVGRGGSELLRVCRASGMSSLLDPDPDMLSSLNDFEMLGEVLDTREVETRRLDDIDEIQHMDFLKIDIQGSELAVFESGHGKLADCAVVQTELSFLPLYRDQPLFWEIDRELRQQGFLPHAFAAIKRWPLAPYVHDNNRRQPLNQLLEADLIYVRDFLHPSPDQVEQFRHLALIAHFCFGSLDLAARCLAILEQAGAVAQGSRERYLDWIGNGREKPKPTVNTTISFDMDFDVY